jgi:anti-sigma factor RsiW
MNPYEAQHPSNLPEFVAGRATVDETRRVLQHLEICQECFEKVERLWQASDHPTWTAKQALPPAAATRVRRRVLKRIHLADLGSEFVRLAGRGLQAALEALADLAGTVHKTTERGEPDD